MGIEPGQVAVTDDQPAPSVEPAVTDPPPDLYDAVSALRGDLVRFDERVAASQRMVEKLHDENERLRAGERQAILRPIQVDLQRLRNDLLRQAETLPADVSVGKMADLLQSFAVTVELALERCGVRVVRPAAGVAFDASSHRAVGTAPAPAPELDATIAECLADGYVDVVTARVITPASVKVYRWDEAMSPVPPSRPAID